jgi:hypothetical protein
MTDVIKQEGDSPRGFTPAGLGSVTVQHLGLVLVPRRRGAVRVDDQGPAQRWMTTWWWKLQSSTQSLTDVLPPLALCLVWCTSHAEAGWVHRPAHWQCLSRSINALRIPAGMVSAYPMSSGRLGPPSRTPSCRRRRARPARRGRTAGPRLCRWRLARWRPRPRWCPAAARRRGGAGPARRIAGPGPPGRRCLGDGRAGEPGGVGREDPGGHMRERPVAPVGEDLLDDGMAAVVPLCLDQLERGVGEDRVVAPGGEQLVLPGRSLPVQVADPPDDQPGGDGLAFLRGERGAGHLGDLGVRDPGPQLVIPDRPWVADRGPGIFARWRRWSRRPWGPCSR